MCRWTVPRDTVTVRATLPNPICLSRGRWQGAVRRVKLGSELGPYAIIDEGLKGGEQVVVQGMESLRPGSPVVASPPPPLSGD